LVLVFLSEILSGKIPAHRLTAFLMKKTLLLLASGLLLAVNACKKNEGTLSDTLAKTPDPASLDQFIQDKLLAEGEFLWKWASDDQIWTALSNADQVLSVGYQPLGETDIDSKMHLIEVKKGAWLEARNAVMQLALQSERALQPGLSEQDLLAFPENGVLPHFSIYVKNPATIGLLRASAQVRYAEPIGYEPFMTSRTVDRSGSGCDSNNPEALTEGPDYATITPGCKRGWNYSFHKIQEAWSNSTGSGIKVVIIDTGSSFDQENLGDAFNQGMSSGRTVEKLVTLPNASGNPPETPNDGCGHGTSMQGACAAPRGTDGASVGVAYNCNLISIRAAEDVYLDASREVTGVANAFTNAGANSSVRIISMSMGRLTTATAIKDAIVYAHNQNKMIFCAAGTSFWWTAWFAGVIFPASLPQAIAVTGQKSNLSSACSDCHTGSKVDFCVIMERSSDGLNPLSLADYGDDPSTVGGSSVSTATTAGIAALVWAKNPGWTRQQVFDKMKISANYYPNRNGNFGWGRVNAQLATN
jgi:subtilisin family serine protease